MASHNDLGRRGEFIAKEYLENQGYSILKINWKYGRAEVDIIANQQGTIIFVEVKTRTSIDYGMPEEFVNYTKARLIMKAAEHYIFDKDWHFDIRFDIISILILPNGALNIRHIEDAFC